jgi:hypothetical protein
MSLSGIVFGFSGKHGPIPSWMTRRQNKRLKSINRFAVLGTQDGETVNGLEKRGKPCNFGYRS